MKKLIFLIVVMCFIVTNAFAIEANKEYDVILFWGQSNMVGHCGKSANGEQEPDTRYDYKDSDSVKAYSLNTGIEEEFLSNSEAVNFVRISQKPNTAYQYYYMSDELVEIDENTKVIGECLIYDANTKEFVTGTSSKYSINKSMGTNMVQEFCKIYVEMTGRNVIAVLCANGGEKIANFLPSTDADYGDPLTQHIYEATVKKYNKAIECVEKNGGIVGKRLYVCCQGESDVTDSTPKAEYKRLFMKVHNLYKNKLGIEKGVIIETSRNIGVEGYADGVEVIHNAKLELVSENDDIILGSTYSYDRYVPDEASYLSKNYSRELYLDEDGEKIPYADAYLKSSLSMCQNSNIVHFTSAALSQIGMETAEILSKAVNREIYMLGDLDGSKEIDIIDVRLLLQEFINSDATKKWTDIELAIMDMDGNNKVDIIDVRLLLQVFINQ